MAKITVQKTDVTILKINDTDYISLTDIAKYKTEVNTNPSIFSATTQKLVNMQLAKTMS